MDLGDCSFLDDDTVLMDDTVNKVINLIKRTKSFRRIGTVLLGSGGGDCRIYEIRYWILHAQC
jgi:hypothetical protein